MGSSPELGGEIHQELKVQFLQILKGESGEFVGPMPVNEVINQRYHDTASGDVA